MPEHMHSDAPSVAELVRSTGLGRARLLAGAGGVARGVRRVQWMEVLDDFADYLGAGDLLLTTAYNLRDDPGLQRSLARRMLDAGVVAMVVKCGYYLDTVPYPVRRQADEIDLPIFELEREVPFVEISQSIYEHLVSRSYARLRRSAAIHRELVELVVAGAQLATIVARAAALLGRPVLVEDDAGRPLAGAAPDGGAPAAAARDGALVAPVVARGTLHGRCLLLAGEAPSPDDQQALEQLATVVALEIARSEHERRAEAEAVAALVLDAVAGRAGDDAALAARAELAGAPVRPGLAVLRLAADDAGAAERVLRRLHARLGSRLPAARDGAQVVVVADPERLASLEEAAGEDVRAGGLGEPAGRLCELPRSDGEARLALRAARLVGGAAVRRYAEVGAYEALLGGLEDGRAARLRERVLEPLAPELRRTLAAYLESGGSVAAAAARLYVHRNTVHYRLRRVEAQTGLALERLEDRLLCGLALLGERLGDGDGAAAPAEPPAASASR